MKLDINALRYLSQEEFRVLTAVEMGQKNVRPRLRLLEGYKRERTAKGTFVLHTDAAII